MKIKEGNENHFELMKCVFFFNIHYFYHQYVIIFNFFQLFAFDTTTHFNIKTSLWINDRNYFSVINISWPSRADGRINNAINMCLEMNQKLKIKIWNQTFLHLWLIYSILKPHSEFFFESGTVLKTN